MVLDATTPAAKRKPGNPVIPAEQPRIQHCHELYKRHAERVDTLDRLRKEAAAAEAERDKASKMSVLNKLASPSTAEEMQLGCERLYREAARRQERLHIKERDILEEMEKRATPELVARMVESQESTKFQGMDRFARLYALAIDAAAEKEEQRRMHIANERSMSTSRARFSKRAERIGNRAGASLHAKHKTRAQKEMLKLNREDEMLQMLDTYSVHHGIDKVNVNALVKRLHNPTREDRLREARMRMDQAATRVANHHMSSTDRPDLAEFAKLQQLKFEALYEDAQRRIENNHAKLAAKDQEERNYLESCSVHKQGQSRPDVVEADIERRCNRQMYIMKKALRDGRALDRSDVGNVSASVFHSESVVADQSSPAGAIRSTPSDSQFDEGTAISKHSRACGRSAEREDYEGASVGSQDSDDSCWVSSSDLGFLDSTTAALKTPCKSLYEYSMAAFPDVAGCAMDWQRWVKEKRLEELTNGTEKRFRTEPMELNSHESRRARRTWLPGTAMGPSWSESLQASSILTSSGGASDPTSSVRTFTMHRGRLESREDSAPNSYAARGRQGRRPSHAGEGPGCTASLASGTEKVRQRRQSFQAEQSVTGKASFSKASFSKASFSKASCSKASPSAASSAAMTASTGTPGTICFVAPLSSVTSTSTSRSAASLGTDAPRLRQRRVSLPEEESLASPKAPDEQRHRQRRVSLPSGGLLSIAALSQSVDVREFRRRQVVEDEASTVIQKFVRGTMTRRALAARRRSIATKSRVERLMNGMRDEYKAKSMDETIKSMHTSVRLETERHMAARFIQRRWVAFMRRRQNAAIRIQRAFHVWWARLRMWARKEKETPRPATAFCSNCAASFLDVDAFCRKCGEKRQEKRQAAQTGNKQTVMASASKAGCFDVRLAPQRGKESALPVPTTGDGTDKEDVLMRPRDYEFLEHVDLGAHGETGSDGSNNSSCGFGASAAFISDEEVLMAPKGATRTIEQEFCAATRGGSLDIEDLKTSIGRGLLVPAGPLSNDKFLSMGELFEGSCCISITPVQGVLPRKRKSGKTKAKAMARGRSSRMRQARGTAVMPQGGKVLYLR